MKISIINSCILDDSNKDDYIYIVYKNCDSELKKLSQLV